jgi:hypothetical protein
MSFDRSQKSYYVSEINRALPAAPQMAMNPLSLNAAFGEPAGGTVNLDSILTEAGGGAGATDAMRRDASCRSLPYPGPGMRDPAARTGCGWWFTPDPSKQSIGAYGTRRGPMSPTLDSTIGPGKWVWDPREAQRLEGMKHTANIRSCPDIQYSTFPNVGWCPTTNMAILTDGAGNPMFPQMPGGDCPGQSIVMNAASCPPPPPPPSAGGGPAPSAPPSITSLCPPGAGGALSPMCLTSLVGVAQCSTQGTLATALSNGYAGTSQQFNNINAVLSSRGFLIHPGIVNDGKLSVNDAISSFTGVRQMANSGDGSRGAMAAANLCYGSAFDPCAMSPSQTGPWDDYADCIAQAAAAKGYSPQGALLPGRIGIAYWNQIKTWGDALNNLDWWMARAHDQSDPVLQAQAIENVYGLNLNFPPQTCPIPGL